MTLIYGHRGARAEQPENSLAGFRQARAAGVAGIETDIAMTADLIPVLHHDAHLPTGRSINSLNFAALPDQVVSLSKALTALPDTIWLLEIKTYPPKPADSHPPALVVQKTLAAIAAAGISYSRLYILAFDWRVLREVAVQAPDLRRVCLTAPNTEAERDLWWGRDIPAATTPRAVAQCGAHAWAAFHQTLTAAQIAVARAENLKIFAWTVNDDAQFTRLAPLVDGIITDRPTHFTQPLHYTPKN